MRCIERIEKMIAARNLAIDPRHVHAYIKTECGAFTNLDRISAKRLSALIEQGIRIVEHNGASYWEEWADIFGI